jgi:hypothetical protein
MSTLVLLMQSGSSHVMKSMYLFGSLCLLHSIGTIVSYLSTTKHNYLAKCFRERTEEFVARAYKGGKKKANHKSSAPIFQRYLYVKETLLSMRFLY